MDVCTISIIVMIENRGEKIDEENILTIIFWVLSLAHALMDQRRLKH